MFPCHGKPEKVMVFFVDPVSEAKTPVHLYGLTLEQLQASMQVAIDVENYEEAALIKKELDKKATGFSTDLLLLPE